MNIEDMSDKLLNFSITFEDEELDVDLTKEFSVKNLKEYMNDFVTPKRIALFGIISCFAQRKLEQIKDEYDVWYAHRFRTIKQNESTTEYMTNAMVKEDPQYIIYRNEIRQAQWQVNIIEQGILKALNFKSVFVFNAALNKLAEELRSTLPSILGEEDHGV